MSRRDLSLVGLAAACAVFLVCWGAIHRGFYARSPIVDTGVYQLYGDQMMARKIPYRDFGVEYPPGALPVFAVPSLAPPAHYVRSFEWLMAALGLVAVVAAWLIRRPAAWYVAVSPLLVGSVILSRFDLWPAALTVAALAALVHRRDRLGWGLLGLAVAAKLWPVVIVPPALAWARRHGRERAALVGAAVFAIAVVPFALIAPEGLWRSVHQQASRPLQIESLGGAVLKAFGDPKIETSHGSQNIVGHGWIATLLVVLQIAAIAFVWARAWRRPDELVRWAAAAVAAFVAFGKVLSPQFLIWLVPLVPLVALPPTVLLTAALLLTQVWFPRHYWEYVGTSRNAWAVLARDLLLVALAALLAIVDSRVPGSRRRRA